MPQVIDLRPDFGNDFAKIFLEKERLSLAKEQQKLQEAQRKWERDQTEETRGNQESLMQGQTQGTMQTLLGTPEGQALLGQAAQPYADAFNTIFGGESTPDQLGLSPQGVAQGLIDSPEPYAAAGFTQALAKGEEQKYTRETAKVDREFRQHAADRQYQLDERRLSAQQAQWEAMQGLERIRINLQRDASNAALRFQGLAEVRATQEAAVQSYMFEVQSRMASGEDFTTASNRASLNQFSRARMPSQQDFQTQAGIALDALSNPDIPTSEALNIALAGGSEPMRQLANLGIDPAVVYQIERGLNEGTSGYEMYKDVHSAFASKLDGLSKEDRAAIETRFGMSAEDYYATQLGGFTTWFTDNYQDQDPNRLITVFRNSLEDPESGARTPRGGALRDITPGYTFTAYLIDAFTARDSSAPMKEREQAIQNMYAGMGHDPIEEHGGALPTAEATKFERTVRSWLVDRPTPTGGVTHPAEQGTTPTPTSGAPVLAGQPEFSLPEQLRTPEVGLPAETARVAPHADAAAFKDFMWDAMTLWGSERPEVSLDPWKRTGGKIPGSPVETEQPGFQSQYEGQSRIPTDRPPESAPGRGTLGMFIGAPTAGQDSFRAPQGDPANAAQGAAVPGWVPAGQEQAYADTAQALRSSGMGEETVRLMLNMFFPPNPNRREQAPILDDFFTPLR